MASIDEKPARWPRWGRSAVLSAVLLLLVLTSASGGAWLHAWSEEGVSTSVSPQTELALCALADGSGALLRLRGRLSGLRQVGRLEVHQEAGKVVLVVRAHILFSPTSFRHEFDFAAVVAAHPGDSFVVRDATRGDRPIAADWSCGASKSGS